MVEINTQMPRPIFRAGMIEWNLEMKQNSITRRLTCKRQLDASELPVTELCSLFIRYSRWSEVVNGCK